MDMPPTRYRVVERGRRLVVIDTLHGGAPVSHAARMRLEPHRPRALEAPKAMRRVPASAAAPLIDSGGGGTVLLTQGWFDAKAPRRIRLDPETSGNAAAIAVFVLLFAGLAFYLFGWILAAPLAFALLHPGARKGLRAAGTKWLDRLDQAARASSQRG